MNIHVRSHFPAASCVFLVMLSDFRFGLKLLWKEKAFTVTALLTLALCIGANTAIFTVLNAVVLEPLPFPESDRIVRIGNSYPGVGFTELGQNSGPDYLDRRQLTDVFESVAIYNQQGFDLGVDGAPVRIDAQAVTPSFLRVQRAVAAAGRTILESEGVFGQDKFALLSYGLWKDVFGKDPAIVGRDVRMSGASYRVVGVMPARFEAPGSDARIWVPLALRPDQMVEDSRHSNNFVMIARLQPGVSVAAAQQRLAALDRQNLERFPKFRQILVDARYASLVHSLKAEMVKDVRPMLYLLQAAVGLVLLIGCVNVANLLLARSNGRIKELAVRFSLGAGRMRLARQLLTESLVLAGAGGALGVLTGYAGVRLLTTLGADTLPRGSSIGINGAALGFSAAVAALTGIVFGSVPVHHLLRRDLDAIFRGSDRGGTADRRTAWTRSALVVCQISIAFVLLTGAGLLTLSFQRVLAVDPGFRPQNVTTAAFSLPRFRYPEDRQAWSASRSVIERVRALPGVPEVGATTLLPFSGTRSDSAIAIEGRPLGPGELPPVPLNGAVSPGYDRAMGIPLVEGRGFTDADQAGAPAVAVIDQFLANKYWPRGGAVGAIFRRGLDADSQRFRIVGVAGVVKSGDLTERPVQGFIYYSYGQMLNGRTMRMVVKTAGDVAIAPSIRRELAQVDPEIALFDIRNMDERISLSTRNRRAAMAICGVFATLAAALAAIGIYGVLAYGVSQRRRELGIRMALGAEARHMVGMVTGHGLKLAAAGLAIGIAGAAAVTQLMSTLLFRVRPGDPLVFAAVAAGLLAVAAAASLIPSARALRIEPATALRHD
jgi:predicted permease